MDIFFNTSELDNWMKIMSDYSSPKEGGGVAKLHLHFDGISISGLRPMHFVSLACLIERYYKSGYNVCLDETEAGKYFYRSLKFSKYWIERRRYPIENTEDVIGLWHIVML